MTACFFSPEYRKALTFCGRNSGRDADKVSECALTPIRAEEGGVYYKEASLVLRLRKLYTDRIRPEGFLDPALESKNYPAKDYHVVYVAEILEVFERED
jgi:flavin reductase (DIM6/NTAB) family NADH-FMN oxidoreductase RutF